MKKGKSLRCDVPLLSCYAFLSNFISMAFQRAGLHRRSSIVHLTASRSELYLLRLVQTHAAGQLNTFTIRLTSNFAESEQTERRRIGKTVKVECELRRRYSIRKNRVAIMFEHGFALKLLAVFSITAGYRGLVSGLVQRLCNRMAIAFAHFLLRARAFALKWSLCLPRDIFCLVRGSGSRRSTNTPFWLSYCRAL